MRKPTPTFFTVVTTTGADSDNKGVHRDAVLPAQVPPVPDTQHRVGSVATTRRLDGEPMGRGPQYLPREEEPVVVDDCVHQEFEHDPREEAVEAETPPLPPFLCFYLGLLPSRRLSSRPFSRPSDRGRQWEGPWCGSPEFRPPPSPRLPPRDWGRSVGVEGNVRRDAWALTASEYEGLSDRRTLQ